MGLDIYLNVFFTLLSIFIFNRDHWEKLMKKNKEIEAKLLVLTLSFALSFLLTYFVLAFVQ